MEGPLWRRCQGIWVGFTVSEDSKPVQRSGTHKAMWLPLVSCHTFIGVRRISTETYSHWRGWGHDMRRAEGGGVEGEIHTNTHIATCTDTQNMSLPGKRTCAHADHDACTYAHECYRAQGSCGSSPAWIPAKTQGLILSAAGWAHDLRRITVLSYPFQNLYICSE